MMRCTQKYISLSASLPSGLNKFTIFYWPVLTGSGRVGLGHKKVTHVQLGSVLSVGYALKFSQRLILYMHVKRYP